ncbi:hypothetical protein AJ88_25235 [Mesorhizobium amorphae CCBAU 01583]|nr:hypothetical protein AJ88_25235 [Mesorhizobium amorphae CCBAU 01583]
MISPDGKGICSPKQSAFADRLFRRSASIQSASVLWIGIFAHPTEQKANRSIHAINDFAKNWAFKEIGVFVA